jgi:hypothetical protein
MELLKSDLLPAKLVRALEFPISNFLSIFLLINTYWKIGRRNS